MVDWDEDSTAEGVSVDCDDEGCGLPLSGDCRASGGSEADFVNIQIGLLNPEMK